MRKVKIFTWAILWVWVFPLYAIGELDDPGPRAVGLGSAGVALAGDSWGTLRNPALGRQVAGRWGGSFSQQFGLPELTQGMVCGAVAVREWGLAGMASSFGSDVYRESALSFGLSRSIRGQVQAGFDLKFLQAGSADYSGYVLAGTSGFLYSPTRLVSVGGVWKHIGGPKLTGLQDRLRESVTAGLAIQFPDRGRAVLDFYQAENFPLEIRTGIEIDARDEVKLRLGTRTNPVRPSGGVTIAAHRWNFHYGFDVHQELGASHAVGVEFLK